jgi:hypothetical protein
MHPNPKIRVGVFFIREKEKTRYNDIISFKVLTISLRHGK